MDITKANGRVRKPVVLRLSWSQSGAKTSGQLAALAVDGFTVMDVWLDVTTQSTGACTVDVGVAADAVTSNDTWIDGVSIAAAGFKNSPSGSNGTATMKANNFITVSVASGDADGSAGVLNVLVVPR